MAKILIFEDSGAENLKPLTWTRPAWGLRCGIVTLAKKIAAAYKDAEIIVHVRPYLVAAVKDERDVAVVSRRDEAAALEGPLLAINGRILADGQLAARIPLAGGDEAFRSGDTIIAARLSSGAAVAEALAGETIDPAAWAKLPTREVSVPVVTWPWDLVNENARQIEADFRRFAPGAEVNGDVHRTAVLEGREQIFIADGAQVQAGAVLLAERGPISVAAGAVIMAGAVIEGPASIGPGSRIKFNARIGEGTTVGPVCKVGGEVEQSILHAYANKQHDGFLGHSYLGAWCNLGADTNTSDLKNNYANVRVAIEGREVDTGSLFAGLFMGDHSKCGINTMFNTGTKVGVGCNIFGADFPPKDMPSFTWGGVGGMAEYDFAKFCETAERVMARREKPLTPAIRAMLEYVFYQTKPRRLGLLR